MIHWFLHLKVVAWNYTDHRQLRDLRKAQQRSLRLQTPLKTPRKTPRSGMAIAMNSSMKDVVPVRPLHVWNHKWCEWTCVHLTRDVGRLWIVEFPKTIISGVVCTFFCRFLCIQTTLCCLMLFVYSVFFITMKLPMCFPTSSDLFWPRRRPKGSAWWIAVQPLVVQNSATLMLTWQVDWGHTPKPILMV